MGILSSLFRNGFRINLGGGRRRRQPKQQPQQNNQRQFANENPMNPPSADLMADIRDILRTEFADLTVTENVAAGQLDPAQTFGIADFVLARGGQTVAAIVLIPKNKDKTKRIWGVERAAAARGFNLVKLYYHFPFSREHVVARIRKAV
ncbi:MAG: hypothetical protein FWE38_04730 [Firmicutes bacterium]|nr:hypothetical protein [Bacillota bacterium]